MSGTALGPNLLERTAVQDPYPLYHELREQTVVRKHVVKTLSTRVRAWVVTGYAETRALLADPRLSKDPGRGAAVIGRHAIDPVTTGAAYPPSMLFSDPPDHTRLRRLLGRAFTVRRVEALRPWITELTGRLLDGVEPGVEFDLVRRIALPVPVAVIGKLLGVPDEMYEDFRRWNDIVVSIEADPELKHATITEAYQALAGLVAAKRSRPGDDLISQLLEADDDGVRMTDGELLATVFLMMNAGYETTANLISSGVLALLLHPLQQQRLRRDGGLLQSAVEEFLRWESPLNLTTIRFTAEEVTIGGVTIPAGEIVFLSLCAANRDPARFPEPDLLDIGRDASSHLAFGHGLHHCLGAPLARMEGQIVLDGLLSRFPVWQLAVPAGDLEWRDSLQFRGLRSLPVRMGFHDQEDKEHDNEMGEPQ